MRLYIALLVYYSSMNVRLQQLAYLLLCRNLANTLFETLLCWACVCRFMWEYSTFLQFAKIILASQVLQALGVPYSNLVVFMAAAPLLAAFRLFYFGTYLPHLPPDNETTMNWQKSHSSEGPMWLTFLTCYHFGLHWEHHRWVAQQGVEQYQPRRWTTVIALSWGGQIGS